MWIKKDTLHLFITKINLLIVYNQEKTSATHKTHDTSMTAGRPPAMTDDRALWHGERNPKPPHYHLPHPHLILLPAI